MKRVVTKKWHVCPFAVSIDSSEVKCASETSKYLWARVSEGGGGETGQTWESFSGWIVHHLRLPELGPTRGFIQGLFIASFYRCMMFLHSNVVLMFQSGFVPLSMVMVIFYR